MEKKILMIAADMDGTMMDSDKNISQRTWEAIERAGECGIHVVPASGRLLSMLPERLKKHPAVRMQYVPMALLL